MNTELYQHLFNNRDKFKIVMGNTCPDSYEFIEDVNNPLQLHTEWELVEVNDDGYVYSRTQPFMWDYWSEGNTHYIGCYEEVCQLDEPMSSNNDVRYTETQCIVCRWIEVI